MSPGLLQSHTEEGNSACYPPSAEVHMSESTIRVCVYSRCIYYVLVYRHIHTYVLHTGTYMLTYAYICLYTHAYMCVHVYVYIMYMDTHVLHICTCTCV